MCLLSCIEPPCDEVVVVVDACEPPRDDDVVVVDTDACELPCDDVVFVVGADACELPCVAVVVVLAVVCELLPCEIVAWLPPRPFPSAWTAVTDSAIIATAQNVIRAIRIGFLPAAPWGKGCASPSV